MNKRLWSCWHIIVKFSFPALKLVQSCWLPDQPLWSCVVMAMSSRLLVRSSGTIQPQRSWLRS